MTRCAMEAASCHNLKPMLIRQELHLEPNFKKKHASFHRTSHIQSQICWMIYKSLASTKQAIQARPLSNHPPRQDAFSCCSCNAVTYCKLHWNISCWNHKTLQACMATQLFHAIQCGRIPSMVVGTNILVAWFKERKAQLTNLGCLLIYPDLACCRQIQPQHKSPQRNGIPAKCNPNAR